MPPVIQHIYTLKYTFPPPPPQHPVGDRIIAPAPAKDRPRAPVQWPGTVLLRQRRPQTVPEPKRWLGTVPGRQRRPGTVPKPYQQQRTIPEPKRRLRIVTEVQDRPGTVLQKVKSSRLKIYPQSHLLNPPDLRKSSESGSSGLPPSYAPCYLPIVIVPVTRLMLHQLRWRLLTVILCIFMYRHTETK